MTTETLKPPTVPLEPTSPIRPSEAIRLGCLIAPVQAFGDAGDMETTACVMGALTLGGYLPANVDYRNDGCPACSGPSGIVHLNDDHRWSRERIADWLAEQGL